MVCKSRARRCNIEAETALNLKANATDITKTFIGLRNVDNTTDSNKPISTATQTALNLKATTSTLNKTSVGLINVDRASGFLKTISNATQSALNLKAPLATPSFTGQLTLIDTSVTPNQNRHVFRMTGLSNIGADLDVSGDIAATGTVWSQNEPLPTTYDAYTKSSSK